MTEERWRRASAIPNWTDQPGAWLLGPRDASSRSQDPSRAMDRGTRSRGLRRGRWIRQYPEVAPARSIPGRSTPMVLVGSKRLWREVTDGMRVGVLPNRGGNPRPNAIHSDEMCSRVPLGKRTVQRWLVLPAAIGCVTTLGIGVALAPYSSQSAAAAWRSESARTARFLDDLRNHANRTRVSTDKTGLDGLRHRTSKVEVGPGRCGPGPCGSTGRDPGFSPRRSHVQSARSGLDRRRLDVLHTVARRSLLLSSSPTRS